MSKQAATVVPIHPPLADRWSPYGFSEKPVAESDVLALFEAARWAPSSYNEQPWRFFLAMRSHEESFARLLSCLVEANRTWAQYAGALIITATHRLFERNQRENLACEHDLGLAVANLSVEATVRGLAVHQMIGIDRDRAREVLAIPADATPITGIAIGYPEAGSTKLAQAHRDRDSTPRTRRPLDELVFEGCWGRGSTVVTD